MAPHMHAPVILLWRPQHHPFQIIDIRILNYQAMCQIGGRGCCGMNVYVSTQTARVMPKPVFLWVVGEVGDDFSKGPEGDDHAVSC